MRCQSKKRRKLMVAAGPYRDKLIQATGHCQICRGRRKLSCHEILNGPLREKVLTEPSCLLVVCWECNQELCNKTKWPLPRQLAVLKRTAPQRYNLERVLYLRNPNAPYAVTEAEVEE